MVAALDDLAVFEHHDGVRIAHGGKPVRDDEHRAPFHQLIHAALYVRFRARVDGACGFIEDQHRRVRNCRAGDGKQLPLALAQVCAVRGEHGVISLGQVGNEEVRVGELRSCLHFFIRRIQPAVTDVFAHRAGKQVRILQNHRKRAAQRGFFDAVEGDAVISDLALLHIVEAVDEVRDGRLASAGGAYEGDLLAWVCIERYVLEHGLFAVVAERYVVETHVSAHFNELIAAFRRFGRNFPGPDARALRALFQRAFGVAAGVDHGHVAVILFCGFIDHVEDALRACERAHHVVHLLRKLADGHGEFARVLQKGSDRAEVDPAGDCEQAACRRGERIGHMAEVVHDGSHDVRKCTCQHGVFGERFVETVKRAVDGVLMAEYLHDLLPFDHFFDVAVHLGKRSLARLEVPPAALCKCLCDEEHQHEHGDGNERENGA